VPTCPVFPCFRVSVFPCFPLPVFRRFFLAPLERLSIGRDAPAMEHASNPAAAMDGERAGLLEPRADGDKSRVSAFRATASLALVATLALAGSALAGGMLRSPGDFAVAPLGVSPEEETTLQSLIDAPDPLYAARPAEDGLSLDELQDMAATLGQNTGGEASERTQVPEKSDEVLEEVPEEESPEETTDSPQVEATPEDASSAEEESHSEKIGGYVPELSSESVEETRDDDVPPESDSVPFSEDLTDSSSSTGASSSSGALGRHPDRAVKFMRIVKPSVARRAAASALGESERGVSGPVSSLRESAWTAPTYFITLDRPGEAKTIAPALEALVDAYGGDAVRRNVRATMGVDITTWPKNIDVAEYAVSGAVALARAAKAGSRKPKEMASDSESDVRVTDEAILEGLPWLDILTRRDDRGEITDPELLSRAHHFGCLLAHLAQWQMALDVGNEDTMVFESDGFLPGLLGVPVSALGAVQRHAPADYDIVFLHHPGEGPSVGEKVTEFTS